MFKFKRRSLALICLLIMFSFQVSIHASDDLSSDYNSFFSFKGISNGVSQLYDLLFSDSESGNLNNLQDELILVGVKYLNNAVEYNSSPVLQSAASALEDDSEAEIIGQPLVYPNPFRQSTDSGAHLYYTLSKDMDVEIHVYNMLAQRIFKQTFLKGANGTLKGKNKLRINNESFGVSNTLSAGIYFFVFMNNGNILSRTKVAIKP